MFYLAIVKHNLNFNTEKISLHWSSWNLQPKTSTFWTHFWLLEFRCLKSRSRRLLCQGDSSFMFLFSLFKVNIWHGNSVGCHHSFFGIIWESYFSISCRVGRHWPFLGGRSQEFLQAAALWSVWSMLSGKAEIKISVEPGSMTCVVQGCDSTCQEKAQLSGF